MIRQPIAKHHIVAKALLTVFWVLGTYLFPLQELTPGVETQLAPLMNLFAEATIILLGIWTINHRTDIALLIGLLVIAIVSWQVNKTPLSLFLNGMRTYLTVPFLLCTLRYLMATRQRVQYFVPLMEKSLYVFLLLQMPVMVIQCIRWGAYDNVGGSLGWMMSGSISTILYVVSFYLMIRRWDNSVSYIRNLKSNWILVVALFPSMLNETKISFIYLALYFFFLIPMDRKFLKRLLYVAPLMVVVFAGFGYVYLKLLTNTRIDGEDDGNVMSMSFINDYVVGNDDIRTLVIDGYMEEVMPDVNETDFARGLKLAVLPIIFDHTPHSRVIGFGPSQFRGGTMMDMTDFAVQYEWLLQGTQFTIMVYMVDLGMFGIIWLAWYMLVLFRTFRPVKCKERRLTWFMWLTMLLSIFYMSIHLLQPLMIIFVFIILISSRWGVLKYVPPISGKFLPASQSVATTLT